MTQKFQYLTIHLYHKILFLKRSDFLYSSQYVQTQLCLIFYSLQLGSLLADGRVEVSHFKEIEILKV